MKLFSVIMSWELNRYYEQADAVVLRRVYFEEKIVLKLANLNLCFRPKRDEIGIYIFNTENLNWNLEVVKVIYNNIILKFSRICPVVFETNLVQ